jgi:hypothetical protein
VTADVSESQLKVMQLGMQDSAFKKLAEASITESESPPTCFRSSPDGPVTYYGSADESIGRTVELGPGDVLYHPAGVWHEVSLSHTTQYCLLPMEAGNIL